MRIVSLFDGIACGRLALERVLYIKPDDIDNMPTIDLVRHGRWVTEWETIGGHNHWTATCSECDFETEDADWTDFIYCPNCGAMMNLSDSTESE